MSQPPIHATKAMKRAMSRQPSSPPFETARRGKARVAILEEVNATLEVRIKELSRK
jgi:hypothetical protein